MAFEIHLRQDIANAVGQKTVTVDNLTVGNGFITVGAYSVPLSNILFVKNLG